MKYQFNIVWLSLPYEFDLYFKVNGKKYDIMRVIGYIEANWRNQPDAFWDEKNDINMSDYDPFESPRASTRPVGRESPTGHSKIKLLLNELVHNTYG